ncbi:MAG: hypothetical protein HY826_15430 [Actinobacteria bacterium]|nr:hypothetical protein [Actinomycetota bacterium]
MTVTVEPEVFRFVEFDNAMIAEVGNKLAAQLGIDRPIVVRVDETTPLGRVRATIGDTIEVTVESGAFEDSKRPRRQSEVATTINLGRILLRVRDRLHGGFGEAPLDDDIALAQMAAWETYCAGRLSRLGLRINRQRWLYNFRNRHGFSDKADAAFDAVWAADSLTWVQLEAISDAAVAVPSSA